MNIGWICKSSINGTLYLSAIIYMSEVGRNSQSPLTLQEQSKHRHTAWLLLTGCSPCAELSQASAQELHECVCPCLRACAHMLCRQENWVRMHLNILACAFSNPNTCTACVHRGQGRQLPLSTTQIKYKLGSLGTEREYHLYEPQWPGRGSRG